MKLRNLFNKLRPSTKKSKILSAVLTATVLLTGAVAFAGWTPNRTVFDWNNPADRTGSANGPVFNSFVNTPYYGDERAFFDAARTDQADGANAFKDVLTYPTQGSKEVILRTYVHNNANQATNASGLGVAKNTRVRITIPTGTETALRTRSYINWDNPAPGSTGEVTDTAELVDGSPFSMQYIPGSAKIYNAAHNAASGGVALSDNIVGSGVQVGYDQMNGNFPGCFDYQAMVEIRVRIMSPTISVTKQVRKAGATTYGKSTTVKPGDKIQWGITVQNKGTQDLHDVKVSDQLPNHVSVVPGSVRYIDTAQDVVQDDKQLFTTGGFNAGLRIPNAGFNMRFDTIAKDDFVGCSITIRNLAFAKSNETPNEVQDYSDVTITKENCNTVTHPGVSIDKKVDGVEKKTVNVNQEFDYQLVVRNTGDVALTNVVVSDNAPANVQFISTDKGSVSGNKLTYTIPALAVGAAQTINIKAKVVAEVAGDIINTACVNAPEVNPNNPNDNDDCDDATVNVPTPIYSCDLLSGTKIGDHKYKFDVRYTAKDGATLKNFKYVYGDGSSVNTTATSTEHTYSNDGTFNIAVAATFTVNGIDKSVTNENCATSITISPNPVTPVYSCDMFSAEKLGVKSYRYTVKFTAHDGATLKYISYDFGDGSDKLMTDKTVVEHTYEKEGTYVPRAVIYFMVNGEEKKVESDKCSAAVTISTPKFCTVPGKETLPVDSPECMTPVTPVTPTSGTLTDTGAGNIFGLFSVVTLAGAFMHRAFADRKSA